MLESVQKQFLIFALRGLGWNQSLLLPPYTSRLKLISLPTLESRRTMLGISFIHNVLKGEISSHNLLSMLNQNIPRRHLRNFELLHISTRKTNYACFDPFRTMCLDYNKFYNQIDISDSSAALKNKILNVLSN